MKIQDLARVHANNRSKASSQQKPKTRFGDDYGNEDGAVAAMMTATA